MINATHQRLKLKNGAIVLSLFLMVFVTGADSFIISPLLPTMSRYFNVSVSQVALGVTVYALCYAVGSPFFGPLGDRFAKKRLLEVGSWIFLFGTVLCGFSTNVFMFYCFRAVAGIGAALLIPNIWAFVGSYFSGSRLAVVMGMVMAALSLSIAIGVPLGSTLSQFGNWHMVFWASGALTMISGAVMIATIPLLPVASHKLHYLANFKAVKNTPNSVSALSVTLFWMLGFYSLYTFLGSFISQQFGFRAGQIGNVFMAYGLGNFFASFFGGVVNNRIGFTRSVKLNGSLSVMVMLLLGLVGNHLWLLVGLLICLAMFQGFGVSALNTFIVNVVPTNRSTVMAFNSSFLYLGLTFGSLIGGWIYPTFGYFGVCLLSALSTLISILVTLGLKPTH